MPTSRSLLRPSVSVCSLLAVLAIGPSAAAADVKLYVQAPYELDDQLHVRFDLDRLHAQNQQPVFADRFQIDYAKVEPALAAKLAEAIDHVYVYHKDCPTIFCPDTDIKLTVQSTLKFSEHGQPKVELVGPASANTVRVTLDTQVTVGLRVQVETSTGIWASSNFPVGIEAKVGIHAGATLTMWPVLAAEDLEVELTNDATKLDLLIDDALTKQLALVAMELVAQSGVTAGKAELEAQLKASVSTLLQQASSTLTLLATEAVKPSITEANGIRDDLMTTPIPRLGRSLDQLMEDAGVGVDVRTRTWGTTGVATVATTRFDPTPGGRQLQGKIRIPKTKCVYGPPVGNATIGYAHIPKEVATINADLVGKACSAVVGSSDLRRVAYLGESPDKWLKTGQAANVLPNWRSMGTVGATGTVVDAGAYYECAFTVSNLADVSILELGVEPGSALAGRMPIGGAEPNVRARFLYANFEGIPLLLDAKGNPRNPGSIVFGKGNPTALDDCPTYRDSGTGWQFPKGFDVAAGLDPDTCPTCGILDVGGRAGTRVRPGDVGRLAHGFDLEAVLAPARNQLEQTLSKIPQQRVNAAGLRTTRGRGRAPLPVTHIRVDASTRGR